MLHHVVWCSSQASIDSINYIIINWYVNNLVMLIALCCNHIDILIWLDYQYPWSSFLIKWKEKMILSRAIRFFESLLVGIFWFCIKKYCSSWSHTCTCKICHIFTQPSESPQWPANKSLLMLGQRDLGGWGSSTHQHSSAKIWGYWF